MLVTYRHPPNLRQRIRDTLDAHTISAIDHNDNEVSARAILLDTAEETRALVDELAAIALDHGASE